jgi:hypothetical protein
MKNRIDRIFYQLLLASLFLPIICIADDEKSIDCTVAPYEGKLFNDLYESSAKTAKTFCNELIRSRIERNTVDNAYVGSILKSFATEAEELLDKKGLNTAANYKDQFNALKKTLNNFDFNGMKMPELRIQPAIGGTSTGLFTQLDDDQEKTARFTISEVEHCAAVADGYTCRKIFQDFSYAFNPYRSAYNNIYNNTGLLEAMGKRWDEFLEVSKSQTALEVWLTTAAQSKHFKKNYLVGPPDYQVIALHPQVIYDSMDKAPDGNNQEFGLAIEWLGVNFWDLKVPLGISIASTYVDRPDTNDTGLGVMLHIFNRYAIGWSKHDGDDSVYVTIDLLKLFEDKKSQYDKYAGYLQQ